MGPKIWPSTPCMANSGVKAAMVMQVENSTELSTCAALR